MPAGPHLNAPLSCIRMLTDLWSALPTVRVATVRATYLAADRVALSGGACGIWRGLLGAALHAAGPAGTYRDLFETPMETVPAAGRLPSRLRGRLGLGGSHAPHPFVLRVPGAGGDMEPGDGVTVELVLIERALRALPALAAALDGLGAGGVGRSVGQRDGHRRGRLHLTTATLRIGRVCAELYDGSTWMLPASCDERLTDRVGDLGLAPGPVECTPSGPLAAAFASPLRIRAEGADVGPDELTAVLLARAVYRRLAALAACYAPIAPAPGGLAEAEDALQALAARTRLHGAALRATDRARYSARQRQRVPAGGVVGPFHLEASPDDLAAWRPLLRRCEAVHLGKGTSQGQGWLRLVPFTA